MLQSNVACNPNSSSCRQPPLIGRCYPLRNSSLLLDLLLSICARVTVTAAAALVVQAGDELSLADVSVLCAVSPLLGGVLSAEARQLYPTLLAWQQACSSNSHISTVLGEQQQQQ